MMKIESVDGWERLRGSRFVGPGEYRELLVGGLLHSLGLSDMVDQTLLDALAGAADDDGLMIDLQPDQLYDQHVSDVLRDEDDPADWGLRYDRFTAMVVMEKKLEYLRLGLLGHRGTGGGADYRLALPTVMPATAALGS